MAYAFYLSTWEAEAGEFKLKASLFYVVSLWTTRALESDPDSEQIVMP